jgi:hypothetical protein
VRAQPAELEAPDVHAVEQHHSLCWVVEALDEANHRGLAAAAAADERDGLAWWRLVVWWCGVGVSFGWQGGGAEEEERARGGVEGRREGVGRG